MRQLELIPCKPLRPYIRLIWLLEVDDAAAFGPPERIAPDGLVEAVFHYRTPFACRYAGEAFVTQPRSAAVSQTRRFVEIRPQGPVGLVSVRFQPWGAYHFFSLPVSEFADLQIAAEHLWGEPVGELEEQLAEAPGDRERVALVEGFLLARLRTHRKTDVEPLVRAVWRGRGQIGIARLCQDLGLSERRLQRAFAGALGTTPKGFSRLSRFLHACRLLRRGSEPTLTRVALACGYYDQSHFIADFKAFSGLTPRAFSEARGVSFLEI